MTGPIRYRFDRDEPAAPRFAVDVCFAPARLVGPSRAEDGFATDFFPPAAALPGAGFFPAADVRATARPAATPRFA
ncbi:hypothetical protein, partial [Myxococcus xanthus]|uniref:hypothetical protein n=1 Tax=Myxococcus xanthus TaxID=34 RepID=UPI00148C3243